MEAQQLMQQAEQGQPEQVPGQPTLSEGDNQGGEAPEATPGQRIATPAGEVNQQTQQTPQAPIIEE